MVSALARLFRISISKGRSIITVREELEHVRNYLIIQKMRFKDQFTYEIEAQEETLEERTVKLIVQPLVENAINHAIDQTQPEALHIIIKAFFQGDDLLFTVEDDGIGISPEILENILTSPAGRSGIGIKNVHERIQLTFGPSYGLQIESEEDEGTLVTIRLPRYHGEEKTRGSSVQERSAWDATLHCNFCGDGTMRIGIAALWLWYGNRGAGSPARSRCSAGGR